MRLDLSDGDLPFRPQGMNLWVPEHETASPELIRAVFTNPELFFSMCTIIGMDSQVQKMRLTPTQRAVLYHAFKHRLIWVDKYRQAKMTTFFDMLLLMLCMLCEGVVGGLLAQTEDTHREHMRRIAFAYTHLWNDPATRPLCTPLKKGTSASYSGIEFEHGGGIYPVTAGSESPGVGRSFDLMLRTEDCEVPDQQYLRLKQKLMPTINRRPNSRIWVESTPGRANSPMHRSWLNALNGLGRYKAVFLKWWTDPSCSVRTTLTEEGYTEEEKAVAARMPGITPGHIAWRRDEIIDECDGDVSIFNAKYPASPLDGWQSKARAVLDQEALGDMLVDATADQQIKYDNALRLHVITEPNPRRSYLICVDPADFGQEGDNSAATIYDLHSWEEVAFLDLRVQPDDLYRMLKRIAPYYNKAKVRIESNCSAVIGMAENDVNSDADDALDLDYAENGNPGWRATSNSIQRAEAAFNTLAKTGDIKLRAKSTIMQTMNFDGKARNRRVKQANGETSHFDRARTVIMAADFMVNNGYVAELSVAEAARRAAEDVLQQERDYLAERRAQFEKARPGVFLSDTTNRWEPGIARKLMLKRMHAQ